MNFNSLDQFVGNPVMISFQDRPYSPVYMLKAINDKDGYGKKFMTVGLNSTSGLCAFGAPQISIRNNHCFKVKKMSTYEGEGFLKCICLDTAEHSVKKEIVDEVIDKVTKLASQKYNSLLFVLGHSSDMSEIKHLPREVVLNIVGISHFL